MKRKPLFFLLFAILVIFVVVIALYVPTSLPTHSDFSALYNTDLALVNRIPIYDIPRVEAFAARLSGLPAEKFFLARFPYPPWYALSTFYLGWLSAKAAATLWFELNLAMLFLSVWFLTDGWSGRLRLIAFPAALFFLPVLGALSVGQYDFPVLLGISLLIYSLRKENVPLTTLGAVLLTFKPHMGALVLVSLLIYLIRINNNFGRSALRSLVIVGIVLFAIGFIADPSWIVAYPRMLLNYQNEGNVAACSECASLPVSLSRWLFDGSLNMATLIAITLLVILVAVFFMIRHVLFKSPVWFITAALVITLLVSPYLYNYDFLLLLVPFAVLVADGNLIQKMIVILCYLIPTFALLFFGRAGNISLTVVTVVVATLLYLRVKDSLIDVPATPAYNTTNK